MCVGFRGGGPIESLVASRHIVLQQAYHLLCSWVCCRYSCCCCLVSGVNAGSILRNHPYIFGCKLPTICGEIVGGLIVHASTINIYYHSLIIINHYLTMIVDVPIDQP